MYGEKYIYFFMLEKVTIFKLKLFLILNISFNLREFIIYFFK